MSNALTSFLPRDIDVPLECRLQLEKIKSDLKQGFRITVVEQGVRSKNIAVEVVTRINDDLFFVMVSFIDTEWSLPAPGYHAVFDLDVRRRKKIPGATLEVFKLAKSTTYYQNENSFRIQRNRGGELEEREFWRRYNSSIVDLEATNKHFEFIRKELAKEYKGFKRFRVIVEQSIEDDPFSINEPKALEA